MFKVLILIIFCSCLINASDFEVVAEDDYFYDWDRAPQRYIPPTYVNRHQDTVNLGRTRLGQGIFRFMSGGRDVELRCEFPTHDLVSNVIWERVTDPTGRSFNHRPYYSTEHGQIRDYMLPGSLNYYSRSGVLQRSEGSSLFLRDVNPSDAGVYRCLASRRVPHSVGRWAQARETVFQDVYFFPGPADI